MKATLKKRKGETVESFNHRLAMAKIDAAFERKASALHGVGGSRNKRWRIAEAERKLTVDEYELW